MPVFTDPQNALRDKFLAGLGHRRGLWVYGPRQSGTSTYMRSFIDPVYEALMDSPGWVGMDPGNKAVAVELEVKQRKVWSAEAILRANAHDLSLWQETVALTERWDALWNANVLLVDDLVAPDVDFWKKHLLPLLDQRLKGPGVTLIAGLYGPDKFGPDWSTALTSLCEVVQWTGSRGEG